MPRRSRTTNPQSVSVPSPRAVAPAASEFAYEAYTIAAHFTFTHRPSDAFVFTTTHANRVNLGFDFGSLLSDPDGMLRGD